MGDHWNTDFSVVTIRNVSGWKLKKQKQKQKAKQIKKLVNAIPSIHYKGHSR